MPEVGLEPTLPGGNRILSPARLPIPPLRQGSDDYTMGHIPDLLLTRRSRRDDNPASILAATEARRGARIP